MATSEFQRMSVATEAVLLVITPSAVALVTEARLTMVRGAAASVEA
jgi:hypothetical protein